MRANVVRCDERQVDYFFAEYCRRSLGVCGSKKRIAQPKSSSRSKGQRKQEKRARTVPLLATLRAINLRWAPVHGLGWLTKAKACQHTRVSIFAWIITECSLRGYAGHR